jgi:hypothetical protein
VKAVDKLTLRYVFEALVGLGTFVAVLAVGEAAFAALSLLALLPLFKKRKLDEREVQLLHRANTLTLVAVYLSMFPVYYLMPGFNWLIALASSFLFFHGLCSLLTLRYGSLGRTD